MNAFGHLMLGLVIGFIASFALSFTPFSFNFFSSTAIALIALGAILPDVDLKQSKVSRVLFLVAIVAIILGVYPFVSKHFSTIHSIIASIAFAVVITSIFGLLRPKHRTITHTPYFAIAFGVITFVISQNIGIAIAATVSCASHLLGDI